MTRPRPRGLGPCDLLTVAEALRVLGLRREAGRAWLESRSLIHHYAGRARVVAGELVAAHDEDLQATATPTRLGPSQMPTWEELQ